uniref:Uncharacterized protein n=1 Tax=viral metagenome TaxID=1070528 RepID=A0A6C0BPS8_9ZZZZ
MKTVSEIFRENHLSYVVSTESNLKNYLVEALDIDAQFIQHFDIHDLSLALEQTLQCRPLNIPTEPYLKSQRLWIMHKLLMTIPGVREKIQRVLWSAGKASGPTGELRVPLVQTLIHFQQRLTSTNVPVFNIFFDLEQALAQFSQTHHALLQQEKQVFVQHRCDTIRRFAQLLCEHGPAWLSQTVEL